MRTSGLWLFQFSVIKSEKNEAAVDKMFRNTAATLSSSTYIHQFWLQEQNGMWGNLEEDECECFPPSS